MSRLRTTKEDLRPAESKRMLKLLVLPIGLILAATLYAVAVGIPLNSSEPVYVDNDLFTTGAVIFAAILAYYTGKTRARTEARADAETAPATPTEIEAA
jgi:hypothetical protein